MLKELKKNKKGFTLAELLIVVAIIAVLVAISIPIFTSQLEKSRDAVTIANLRSAYAEASAAALTGSSDDANVIVDNAFKDGVGKIRVADVAIKSTDADYEKRVEEIHEGKYDDLIEQIMQKPITDMEELYNNREIEK